MQYYKLLENIQSKYWSPVWSESNLDASQVTKHPSNFQHTPGTWLGSRPDTQMNHFGIRVTLDRDHFSGSSVYLSRSTSNYEYCVHTCTRERETINHSSNSKFQWSSIFEARTWGFLEFSLPSKLNQFGSTERHYGQLLVYTERHCNIVPTCPESTLLKGPTVNGIVDI